ncbi:MAG: DUF3048 C-terminal domain-containing protein [Bacillota bacterium]
MNQIPRRISGINGGAVREASGDLLRATNVIIQKVSAKSIAGDSQGWLSLQLTGSGEAWILSGGKTAAARWHKEQRGDRTIYLDEEGNPVPVLPGVTWVLLVPERTRVTIK